MWLDRPQRVLKDADECDLIREARLVSGGVTSEVEGSSGLSGIELAP